MLNSPWIRTAYHLPASTSRPRKTGIPSTAKIAVRGAKIRHFIAIVENDRPFPCGRANTKAHADDGVMDNNS